MSKRKKVKISTLGSRVTSVISVSLVLFILGLLAMLGLAASRATNSLLGDISVIVKLDVAATPAQAKALDQYLRTAPFAREVSFTSAEQVMEQEMEYNADVLDLLGENPYSAEYEVKLGRDYLHPDSIRGVSNHLMLLGGVDEVVSQVEMIKSVSNAIRRVTWVLSVVAGILLLISLVLIFNTVSIGVYGRRFVIRTMQLVGATAGFIRRPFVVAGVWSGVVSALVASVLLLGTQLYVESLDIDFYLSLPWEQLLGICGILLVLGVAICSLAAYFATNRYLRLSTDSLYV